MPTRTVPIALALAALTLPASPARADAPAYDCRLASARLGGLNGPWFEGVAVGYALHPEGGEVSVFCYVTVNGVRVDQTPVERGSTLAATRGFAGYAAERTDVVEVCARVTWYEGDVEQAPPADCFPTSRARPLQPLADVIDVLNTIWDPIQLDPLICPVLASLTPGVPGAVDVNNQGDIALLGSPFWDCPPYEDPPPGSGSDTAVEAIWR